MFHVAPAKDSLQVAEMIPNNGGTVTAEFPTGAIAQAWMDEHSRQLTWADLRTWLFGDHPF